MTSTIRPPFIDIGSVRFGEEDTPQLEILLQQICNIAVGSARTLFPEPTEKIAMTLLEVNPDSRDPSLFVAACDGYPDSDLEKVLFTQDVRLSNSMSGTVIRSHQSVCLPDVKRASEYYSLNHVIKSAIGAPVRYGNEIFGALCVESEEINRFTQGDMRRLEQLAEGPAVALRLYRNSILNFRTGLYNSNFYERKMEVEIAKSIREGTPLGLLIVDIDYLKEYNTARGLTQGSWMIRKAARTTKTEIPNRYFVARYGGDEFAIILPDAEKQECLEIAERVRRSIENLRIEHPGIPRKVRDYLTVSIGVSHSTDPFGAQYIEDTASLCLNAAKGKFLERPKPGEDLEAFNRQRDAMIRNQVVSISDYGPHLDPARSGVVRHNGVQVEWKKYTPLTK